ncbi:MAG: Rpn family recombination-promoting nuclease/putative transposase, partial [Prevotellaceae bacterium]|nr:Rpn family recombination-promoting nuclease/putative transposase [Prevotellaceae bacterium]
CKDSKGRQFIVEMQMEWEAAFLERMLYNTAKIYGNQIEKGYKYVDLQPVYGLAILNGIFDRKTEEYYHSFIMQNPQNPEEKISGMNIVLIELKKFAPHSRDEKELTVLWLRFLKEINEKTRDISPEFAVSREICEAIEICEEAAYSDIEKIEYDIYWDTISREKTLIFCNREAGKAEGKEEGRAEGRLEGETIGRAKGRQEGREEERRILVLNLVNNGFSAEQTAKMTGLPIETVTEIMLQK